MLHNYTERNFLKKRHYDLGDDKIVVSAKPKYGSEFQNTIPLVGLRIEKAIVFIKPEARMILWAIPGVIVFVLVMTFSESIINTSLKFYYSLIALSVISAGLGVAFTKKIL